MEGMSCARRGNRAKGEPPGGAGGDTAGAAQRRGPAPEVSLPARPRAQPARPGGEGGACRDLCVCVGGGVDVCMEGCMRTRVCMWVHVYSVHLYLRVCMCVYMWISVCVYMCIYA